MQRPAHNSAESTPHTLSPAGGGWHCSHLYYSFDRARLTQLSAAERADGSREVAAALDPAGSDAPIRLQSFIVSGHKADFGVMALDPDPLKVDRVHQRLLAGPLGPAIVPRWSFVSITEISEYVQSAEDFGQRLVAEGMDAGSDEYKARVKGYADRLEGMNRQRLTPDFSAYRAMCFYPMNKKRKVGENWFTLPKEERGRLMIEHARSGMAFAGRVTQLITVGVGLEDWEWGVTLWAANPEYLKEIVYRMRFDEASARYAEFGPFYTGYVSSAAEILAHCMVST
ncbi:MAG TPA: hydrogen peroxide-dependent heme synthase [Lacipirellulaceae bacterium]|jgi:chlorite dismutase|nr:hydrogen peroxide-dependent heme synthase [Lacipirellulaceae bacterium]